MSQMVGIWPNLSQCRASDKYQACHSVEKESSGACCLTSSLSQLETERTHKSVPVSLNALYVLLVLVRSLPHNVLHSASKDTANVNYRI